MKKLFLIPFLSINIAIAQQNITPNQALAKFNALNYNDALTDYLQLLTQDGKNELYNYNVGLCYLNGNSNKAKAIPYLEIVTRVENHNPNADYLLAKAYLATNRFDDALNSFKKYKELNTNFLKTTSELELEIQQCLNAKELIKYPIDATFQNLGKTVNSEYNDNSPFVSSDDKFLIYNSNKPTKNAVKLSNGSYSNSVYISKITTGNFSSPKIAGSLNTGTSQMQIIALNASGNIALFYNAEQNVKGGIYIGSVSKKGAFSKLQKLDASINSGNNETAASISPDGTTIYFASTRAGSLGGKDIYYSKLIANGKWSEAKNAGTDINTIYDEDFPTCSPDGKTLYFSSKGHTGMGGYDIFKSTINEFSTYFSKPKNIGYPLNTTDNDYNFLSSKNGTIAYISSAKSGSLGDFDLYRVNINEDEIDYSVVIGEFKIPNKEQVNFSDVFITVNHSETNELIGNYLPNPANGRFIIILPPGKYQMSVEVPDFKTVNKPIIILDKVSYQAEINLTIELSK